MADSSGGPHKFDKSNLREMIFTSPRQFEEGFKLARDVTIAGKFSAVVFSGVGGSAFPSQLLEIIVREAAKSGKTPVPIYTNHSYNLPPEVEGALNVCCSYSGNTEETISALTKAIELKLPVIGVASGGRVMEICSQNNVPFVKLPMPFVNFQPRIGTGYFVSVMLKLMANHGLAADIEDEVLARVPFLIESMANLEEKGKVLASKIAGKTPIIYASEKFSRVAMVFKIKFNEHAKNPAFWNFFPELNHNEMVGFTKLAKRYFLIMLKDNEDDARNLKRYQVMSGVVKEVGLESETIDLEGSNAFSKIFYALYLADFVAYYLSEFNGVDPTPVEMVEKFKRLLVASSK